MKLFNTLLVTLGFSLSLSACAGMSQKGATLGTTHSAKTDLEHVVERGEILSGIAYSLTGKHDNWVEIAKVNGIENPRSLTAGSVLLIPGHLIKSGISVNTADRPVKTGNAKDITVFQPTAIPGPKQVKVTTAKADIPRTFKILENQLTASTSTANTSDPREVPDNLSDWVLVIGSYYPKGIYQQPDAGSRILMRVAPGSRLRLNANVDGWLKVETEKGSGYIRRSDAEVLSAKKPAAAQVVAGL